MQKYKVLNACENKYSVYNIVYWSYDEKSILNDIT